MTGSSLAVPSGRNLLQPRTIEEAWNFAGNLCKSNLIPQTFRENPANVIIAIGIANELGFDVFSVMNNIYVVHGKPGFSGQFYVSCVNRCGRYSPIRYEWQRDKDGNAIACRVVTSDIRTKERLEGSWVSLEMAVKEGWAKNNQKWQTMPEQMMQYRSAAFFVRAYCPDVTMGYYTRDELEDISIEQPDTIPNQQIPTDNAPSYLLMLDRASTLEEVEGVCSAISQDKTISDSSKRELRKAYRVKKEQLSSEIAEQ